MTASAPLPEEAVTAAYAEFQKLYPQRTAAWDDLAEWERDRWRRILEAAAPLITAPLIKAHLAEQDAVLADLGMLLRVLGLGDHAQPESPHKVMLDAINEAGQLRSRLEFAEHTETWIGDQRQRTRQALTDALEGLEDMFPYVPEHFKEKWEHQGYIDRVKAALAALDTP